MTTSTPTLDATTLSTLARTFKSLHQPGQPILLANVHDAHSAHLIANHPSTRAIATASWSISATQGIPDDSMTLSQNLTGIRNVIRGVFNAGKQSTLPITADLQDGYDDIAASIRAVIAIGCVGANIEDLDCKAGTLRSVADAAERVRIAVRTAREEGVEDFVINARTDVLGFGGGLEDVVERGRAYLDAGATTCFVWGVRKWELNVQEVKGLCERLEGRVAVQGPGPTGMAVSELRTAGVSRISMGPWYFRRGMDRFGKEAVEFLDS